MNYLAHIYLSEPTPEGRLGGFLGDFIKGSLDKIQEPALRRSIALHRKIDSYTDSHPIVVATKQLFPKSNRKYAGIALDIFYDYFLTKHFEHFSALPLQAFADNFYNILNSRQDILPETIKPLSRKLIENNFLCKYGTLEDVYSALVRLSARTKYGISFEPTIEVLVIHHEKLQQSFHELLPQLIEFSQQALDSLLKQSN
ncbi:MAG: ACP phosphodiesterase [Acidobacteriota bacterium]|nr:ACP phosphodiesterase [Blastocatellia bacterium]MDW8411213.1 ACP phosphodiesterase [Acidobacteriota bacterium]